MITQTWSPSWNVPIFNQIVTILHYRIKSQHYCPRISVKLIITLCGPLNRKGLVCNECADGFGPSVTSFGYKCVKCTDAWYSVALFLFIKLFPITILYFIIFSISNSNIGKNSINDIGDCKCIRGKIFMNWQSLHAQRWWTSFDLGNLLHEH